MNIEQYPAEEARIKSEERHSSLLRAAMDGFWMVDREGRLLEVNAAYCEMSGYSEAELRTMKISDLQVAEMIPAAAWIAKIMELGQDRFATRHRRKDGRIIAVEVSACYCAGEDGRIIAFLRDCSEQRRADDARQGEQSLIRAVIDNLPIGIAVNSVDPGVSFLYMNDNFPKFYRTTREALASPDAFWSAAYQDPDFRAAIKKQILADCASGDADKMRWIDVPITRAGDRTTYVEARNTLTPDRQLMVSAVWDVTGRKEAELALQREQELYKDLVKTLPAGAYRLRARIHGNWQGETWEAMAAAQYSLDFASDRFCAILGITHHALAANIAVVSDLIHPKDRDDFNARNAQAMTDFSPFIWEGRIIRNDQTRWVHFESLPRMIDPETLLWTGIVYDITALKQTEKEREQFYKFFQSSTDLMCIADPDGAFIKTNPAFTVTLGYTGAELIAQPFIAFIHPDDQQATLDEMAKQQQRGFTINFENRYRCKDGSFRWLSWRANYHQEERVTYATARDVTARKEEEEARRESEERMDLAMQAGSMGLYDLNVQTGEAVVNPEYALMLGYDPGEFHETNARWVERLHPDDREPVAAVYSAYIRGEIPQYKVEFRQKTRDGNWKWILSLGKIMEYDAEGNPQRMLGVHVDLSERKQVEEALRESENRLRFALEGSNDGLWDVQMKTGTTYLSPRGWEILGYPPIEVDEAANIWSDLIHPDDRLLTDERLQAHLDGRAEIFEVEQRLRMKSGEWKWILARGKVVARDESGLPLRMTGTHTDLTEQKKLQEQLSQAQKMESMGRLAGGVAHDFNNMLSVILGHTELARMKGGGHQPLLEHLEQIEKAAERSAAIVRQLLAYARKQTVTPRVLDLNETVESMLKMLRRLIGEDIDLAWLPGEGLWPVRMDPAQIDQILVNLCVNARDAVADVGRITIETGKGIFDPAFSSRPRGFAAGEYDLLTVRDDGCGMDQETLAQIFEPFFTTKGVGQGTGLGLSTVYGIVKQNAGFVDVASEPGHGTCFKIYLPRYQGKVEGLTTGPAKPAERGQETILLVEDEPAILDLSRQLLEMQGYRVLAAATPGEALRLAAVQSGEIHLLLTDVIMPEMNGRDLARRLLALYPGLKRLFMSGYTADIIAHHGVLDDEVQFIQKPFALDALAAKVRAALDQ